MKFDKRYLLGLLENATAPDSEYVTPEQLQAVERYLDKLFKPSAIDIDFTRHFLDRVNDARNGDQITADEIVDVFRKVYRYLDQGKKISVLGPDVQAVISDMRSDINIPFVLKWDSANRELDLVSKTIMRKRRFGTSGPHFKV